MPRLSELLSRDAKVALVAEADAAKASAKANAKSSARTNAKSSVKRNVKKDDSAQMSNINFVAVDVETTGLEFKTDRVIEIGAVKFVDGVAVGEFSTFINAGEPIPDHISRLTNIYDDDIKHAPSFADVAQDFIAFADGLPLCGHQIEFDLTFINEEMKRAGVQPLAPQLIDTALLSRILLQHVGRFSLKHACNALGITLDNAHRALYDAKASGELALKLIPMLRELPQDIRRALAAFAPGSLFKTIVVKSLGNVRYGVDLDSGKANAPLERLEPCDDLTKVNPKVIDDVFSENGHATVALKNFTVRDAQLEMAHRVTGALNDAGILAIEAGTGTGKSLAYLVPAALHALANNCRVVVSTHTRNLQDQLITSDLPAASAIINKCLPKEGGALRFTKLKGRRNYLCRDRFYKLLQGGVGNLSARERYAVLPLVPWSQTTRTGDIEEQTFFNAKWFYKIWNLISSDGVECGGKRCRYRAGCFMQKARQLAQTSHIVVINHALFYSDICAESSLLGTIGSIIFDEAHHLESTGHEHLRTEFDTNRANGFIDTLQNFLQTAAAHKHIPEAEKFEADLKNHLKQVRKCAQNLLAELDAWSRTINNSAADFQIPTDENSLSRLREPAIFDVILSDLQDTLRHARQSLSIIKDADRDRDRRDAIDELRDDMQLCAELTSQLRADLQYLVAAKTDDHVFWAEGNRVKKWIKLCGVPLDISEMLADIWSRCLGGVVFTSATLATQGDTLNYFKRSAGLDRDESRLATAILKSPYSPSQTLFGALRNAPEPDSPSYARYVADCIAAINVKLRKNTLVLFTSNAMLANVYNELKEHREIDRNNLLAQGISAANRTSLLEQFKEQRGMILLGTDSFWEGVDAPGESCEVLIITRFPFQVPTHPLTQAMAKRMEERFGNSFFSYSVPEAIIKFRQGIGRLIRSHDDRGLLLVLDNRIINKNYGKEFAKSVGSKLNVFDDVGEMVGRGLCFFER